jgi:hypothetical protein
MPLDAPPAFDWLPWLALVAVGVGNIGALGEAPPPLADVRSANIRRGQDSVAPGISERHKVSDDHFPAPADDGRDVFKENVFRADDFRAADNFAVEPASFPVDSSAFACEANILARESR